jgi:hypothetical protein
MIAKIGLLTIIFVWKIKHRSEFTFEENTLFFLTSLLIINGEKLYRFILPRINKDWYAAVSQLP